MLKYSDSQYFKGRNCLLTEKNRKQCLNIQKFDQQLQWNGSFEMANTA